MASRAALFAALVALAASVWAALDPAQGALALLLAAAAVLVAGAAWLERGPDSARELTLIATLAGVAAAGRVLFAGIPSVQPVTVIVVAAGAALGPRAGFSVGALAALASNFFLGQGVWTPWQMLAWGGCGVVGGLASGLLRGRFSFAALCCVLGLAFGTLMDIQLWLGFYPHTWDALVVVLGRGVWFSVAHAVGNVVIALAIGPELRRLLERYGRKLRVEIAWA